MRQVPRSSLHGAIIFSFSSCFFPFTNLVLSERNHLRYFIFRSTVKFTQNYPNTNFQDGGRVRTIERVQRVLNHV